MCYQANTVWEAFLDFFFFKDCSSTMDKKLKRLLLVLEMKIALLFAIPDVSRMIHFLQIWKEKKKNLKWGEANELSHRYLPIYAPPGAWEGEKFSFHFHFAFGSRKGNEGSRNHVKPCPVGSTPLANPFLLPSLPLLNPQPSAVNLGAALGREGLMKPSSFRPPGSDSSYLQSKELSKEVIRL